MSKMSELSIEIMERAQELGDPFGFETSTVESISQSLRVTVKIVEGVFDCITEFDLQ